MSIPVHIVKALLALGEASSDADMESLIRELDPFHREAHSIGRAAWVEMANSMEPAEFRSLIRGVVRAEELGKWYGGSASIVVTLFRAYQNKRQPDEEELAEWVMRNSSNDYAPFGSMRCGARSLEELRALNTRVSERKRSAANEEKRRAEEGVQKRKDAVQRHERRMENQALATANRNAEVERLRDLPFEGRLSFLLQVPTSSLGYYPTSLLSDDSSLEWSMNKGQRSELIQLIRTSGNRSWKKWAKVTFGPFNEISGEAQK